jgi:hypothetical protein
MRSIGRFFSRFSPTLRPNVPVSGDALMTGLLVLALAGLLAALARLWLGRLRSDRAGSRNGPSLGHGTLLAEITGANGQAYADPWSEALRRRGAGDLAGALVCIFIHELLSLDQLGIIRIVPGLTGRQYVLSLSDPNLQRSLFSTLVLFEEAHYGHRRPSETAFNAAWEGALAFRRHWLGVTQ